MKGFSIVCDGLCGNTTLRRLILNDNFRPSSKQTNFSKAINSLIQLSKKSSIAALSLASSFVTAGINTSHCYHSFQQLHRQQQEQQQQQQQEQQQQGISPLPSGIYSLKQELLPFLDSLGDNTSLTELDVRGHLAGDQAAIAVSKALKSNTKLTMIDLDGNGITLLGFQALRYGLKDNFHLFRMPLPVRDFCATLKSETASSSSSSLQRQWKLQRTLAKVEALLARNAELRLQLRSLCSAGHSGFTCTSDTLSRLTVRQLKDNDEGLRRIIDDKQLAMCYREFLHRHYSNEVTWCVVFSLSFSLSLSLSVCMCVWVNDVDGLGSITDAHHLSLCY